MSIQISGTTVIDDSRNLTNTPNIPADAIVVSGTTQTAAAGKHYILTNGAATTVTLPAGSAGITVAGTNGNGLSTNVIARNGADTIMGLGENMTLDSAYAAVTLRYLNNSWRVI